MRTLVMLVSTWCLVLYSVRGVLANYDFNSGVILGINRCSVYFRPRSLQEFHGCLCAGFQTCKILPRYWSWSTESHSQKIEAYGTNTDEAGSSNIQYVCDATCTHKQLLSKVDPITCRRVKPDESESKCKEGPECNKICFTEKSYCQRCIDIRWSNPGEIKVSTGYHDILQRGQCPRECAATLRSSSVDLSAIFSNESVLSNATSPSAVFPRTTFTEESEDASANGADVHVIVIPLVLAISVIAIAATILCVLYRRGCKLVDMKLYTDIYVTPLDVIYDSSESLVQGQAGGNGRVSDEGLHSYVLERSSHIYLALENEYVGVSFPDSSRRGPVQTSEMYAGACLKTSVHENAERDDVYADLGKTARTTEASSKAHYANNYQKLPNNSSTTATTSPVVTNKDFSKENRLSQGSSSELNYSTINDCAERTDHTLKHCSSKCENASFVCNDVGGAYKIMKPTITNVSDITKTSHDSSSSGRQLLNKMVYTRLGENPERVSNVYDDLVTESDDYTFKSAFLSSSLDSEDENISVLCPLHKKQCSQEDHANDNVYENRNSGLNIEGSYVNNAMVSGTRRLRGIYSNSGVEEDKTLESATPYINYTDPEVKHAQSLVCLSQARCTHQ